ncbi:MAG: bifunctional DNA-formamidopyrimidine glycosylase/DNA-(apurinic or apyrimidinic site) lyase [Gemmatales bacterium]|nr:bifunctional DNA-formamidopyrimidine glycosylase/DNA-(apurinic or apyrimidinic site) lyase [Gemmatales bacterium]MDW8175432.1 bifunctional DNA-formamidopyrimidine glycosylase/DNA-(apurinic or apyrimidinic site) lyase [Gemmatales bacterium]
MPELPEVETVVRTLRPHLVGLTIMEVHCSRRRLRRPVPRSRLHQLVGQTFTAAHRRGKWILLDLEKNSLLVHLGMTGRLQLTPAHLPCPRHCHLILSLRPHALQLRFTDSRRFGAVLLLPIAQARSYLDAQLGPEPSQLTPDQFFQRLQKTKRAIKLTLMDQTILAGLGNIYADEALFHAGLPPWRPANTLSAQECQRLLASIQTILQRAIACRGSSIRDYMFGENGRGTYQEEFLVYGRFGQACSRCQQPIARTRLSNRSSYYCPHCQGVMIGAVSE